MFAWCYFFLLKKQKDCGKFAQNTKSHKNVTVVEICDKFTKEKKQFRYYPQISSAMSVLLRKTRVAGPNNTNKFPSPLLQDSPLLSRFGFEIGLKGRS